MLTHCKLCIVVLRFQGWHRGGWLCCGCVGKLATLMQDFGFNHFGCTRKGCPSVRGRCHCLQNHGTLSPPVHQVSYHLLLCMFLQESFSMVILPSLTEVRTASGLLLTVPQAHREASGYTERFFFRVFPTMVIGVPYFSSLFASSLAITSPPA